MDHITVRYSRVASPCLPAQRLRAIRDGEDRQVLAARVRMVLLASPVTRFRPPPGKNEKDIKGSPMFADAIMKFGQNERLAAM